MEHFVPKKIELFQKPCFRRLDNGPNFCLSLLIFGAAIIFLPKMVPLHGTMAEQLNPKHWQHVSPIYAIDQNVGQGRGNKVKSFYVKLYAQDTSHFAIYMCYLSQLDENYRPSNKSLQIRAGFELHNTYADEMNDVAEQCNPMAHEWFGTDEANKIPRPNAWHGIKFENAMNMQTIHIRTSFSKEIIHLKLDSGLDRNYAYTRIHFGTPESPLCMQYTNHRGTTISLEFPEDTTMPRVPPVNALDGVPNIRDAFQANPGAWLVPMDMAQLEMYNNIGPTRMLYFVASGYSENNLPNISYVMERDHVECKVKFNKEKIVGKITPPNGGNSEKPIRPKSSSSALTTEQTTTEEITTTEEPKPACKTLLINAKAAIIRDHFHDLASVCPEPTKPETCKEHVDYAVRLGCISCKLGITQKQQNYFMETLREWLKNEEKRLEQGDFVYNEFDEWKGTQLYAYLKSPDKQQTIDKIESGGFRYITVPKLWAEAENGLYMMVQECEGLGQFATAVHNGTVAQNSELIRIDAKYNWEKKFVFLEKCEFEENLIVDDQYRTKTSGWISYSQVYEYEQIHFGTYKWNAQRRVKEDYTMSYEDIQAHKFKYGWSDPIRENEFVGEAVNNYERVKRWGRYIVPQDQMYENYNSRPTHKYKIYLKIVNSYDFHVPGGRIHEDTFRDANVRATVVQMEIKCGDIYHMSTRVNAIQQFDLEINGRKVPKLVLQTTEYKLDGHAFELIKDPGQECVEDVDCLRNINLYKYNSTRGK